jgi:hypothetical protein
MSTASLPGESAFAGARRGPIRVNPSWVSLSLFDYGLLAALSLLLVPAFILARLPFRMDFLSFAKVYWIGTSARSAFVATLLLILGFPIGQTLAPALRRYRAQKMRIVIALTVAVGLSCVLGLWMGLVVTVDALALAELMERKKDAFERTLVDIFFPGLFLFLGVILIFAFNTAIAGIRWAGTYDAALRHVDWILFHANVSSFSHWVLNHSPRWYLALLEFAYFGLFQQLGATIFLAVLLVNQRYAAQFVRALLVAFTIAVGVFFVLPAKGPYFTCPDHLANYPRWLTSFTVQQQLGEDVRILWAHAIPPGTPTVVGYFVSFPCMHIALAVISLWFLRRWKKIFRIVLAFDAILLIPSILILEWHYFIGMFGGIATAGIAIWISALPLRSSVCATSARRAAEWWPGSRSSSPVNSEA